jgi:transcriptional regulator with XRE-family HTH domain
MIRKTIRERSFSDQLRRAINNCGMTRYQIAKRTGISQATLSRFMSGQRGLTLGAVDKLAALLTWKLEGKGRKRPTRPAPRATRQRQRRKASS